MQLKDFKVLFKDKRTALLTIGVISFFFLSVWFIIKYEALSYARDKQIIQASVDTLIKYKTRSGDSAYKIKEKLVTNTKERDSIAKELLIAKAEVERLIKITTSSDYSSIKGKSSDSVYKDKNGKDQVRKYGSYEDGYISIAAVMDDSLRFTKLQTRDTLLGVFQKHKEGGVTINNLIVTNKSPYGHITGLENISYKEEPQYRRWSLGAHVGYSFITKQPDASIGINYDLFRFKK